MCINCQRFHPDHFTGCFTDTEDTFQLNQKLIEGQVWFGCITTTSNQFYVPAVGLNLLKLDMPSTPVVFLYYKAG